VLCDAAGKVSRMSDFNQQIVDEFRV